MTYKYAPIKEAVIEFRVSQNPGLVIEKIKITDEWFGQNYPLVNKRIKRSGSAEFKAHSETPKIEETQEFIGFQFTSTDKNVLIFFEKDRFTLILKQPYENWEVFRTTARKCWEVYLKAFDPVSIERVGLRYVNQFNVTNDEQIAEYLVVMPNVPNVNILNTNILDHFIKIVNQQTDLDAILILHSLQTESSIPEQRSFLLDIDLSRVAKYSKNDFEEPWVLLDNFRSRKNEIFEAAITDKARAKFEPIQ